MRPTSSWAPAAVLLAALLAGCNSTQPLAAPLVDHPAPEIQGDDVDGQPMKLSDFRGKVVMLDFWGDW